MRLRIGILFGILLVVAGLLWGPEIGTKHYEMVAPLGTVIVTADRPSRDQFFEKLKEFAGENGFTCQIEAAPPPDDNSFVIQMYRRDMMIIGANELDDLPEFHLGYFENDQFFQFQPLPQARVDAMMVALRESLLKVKGVTSEIQRP